MKKIFKFSIILTIFGFLFFSFSGCSSTSMKDKTEEINIQRVSGHFLEAIANAKESLALAEKEFGPDSTEKRNYLNVLGNIYLDLGDFDQARNYYEQSIEVTAKSEVNNAIGLNNIANTYLYQENFSQAEPIYLRALKLAEKANGQNNTLTAALILCNLTALYSEQEEFTKAEAFLNRSESILQKAGVQDEERTAQNLLNLGKIRYNSGEYSQAEQFFKRNLSYGESGKFKSLEIFPTFSLNSLATVYIAQNNPLKAHFIQNQVQKISEQEIDYAMGIASDELKLKYLTQSKIYLDDYLSLINQKLRDDMSSKIDGVNIWLKRKGIILESQKIIQNTLVNNNDPVARHTYETLINTRIELSNTVFSDLKRENPELYETQLRKLEKQKNDLQTNLVKLSKTFAIHESKSKANCSDIVKKLLPKTALIEFARIKYANFKKMSLGKKHWSQDRYLAFILHAGEENRVEWIDLGPANVIDSKINEFQKEIATAINVPMAKNKYSSIRKLHDLLFLPLKVGLRGTKTLFISPDGMLNLVPFEVLQSPDGRFLIEEYGFNYLTAGRDIVAFNETKESGQKSIIFGDPDFDMEFENDENGNNNLPLSKEIEKKQMNRSVSMNSMVFQRLPESKKEAEIIGELLGAKDAIVYTGIAAKEEMLNSMEPPEILHLATHGFFLEDLETNISGMFVNKKNNNNAGLSEGAITFENPLMRSGFVLAGANASLDSSHHKVANGIVTAEKILNLNLNGTEMVVLSACNTGLGDVKAGEGVYGLRRAFIQAGTRSLIMSMWSVPDKETRELMVAFYSNLKKGQMSRSQALRKATLEEMQIVKKRYGFPNPSLWGAFVFLGES